MNCYVSIFSPKGLAGGTPYLDINTNSPLPLASYLSEQRGSISNINYLYIADTDNNRIRGLSAICTMICENGGTCIRSDTCSCPNGWSGIDCTIPVCSAPCPENTLCVGPESCRCKPGFGGTACRTPQCQQNCHNGAVCTNPDTCTCKYGWFGTDCTVPVCKQTCGNDGNCVGPDTCQCSNQWKGTDCRTPVCTQSCLNGGLCVAPNTCICPPNYINQDCSVPVCSQGMFRPNVLDNTSTPHFNRPNDGFSLTYKYCNIPNWCNSTAEFECDQLYMKYQPISAGDNNNDNNNNNNNSKLYLTYPESNCILLELPLSYKLPFEIRLSDNSTTGYHRYVPSTPYTNNVLNPWSGILNAAVNHTGPYTYRTDRQVVMAALYNVSQGVYVCANNGNCTAPNVCECASGWIGFDCRTPVCNQGYFQPKQKNFISGLETDSEVSHFLRFLGNNSYRLIWPYSNPKYEEEIEKYENESYVNRILIISGGVPYEGPRTSNSRIVFSNSGSNKNNNEKNKNDHSAIYRPFKNKFNFNIQGGYRCSIRLSTLQENQTFLIINPNYYSKYMDSKTQIDGQKYTYWVNMSWPPITSLSRVLTKKFHNLTFQYTKEGYKKFGIWSKTSNVWTYGTCITEFYRNCSGDHSKEYDLHSGLHNVYVQDTDLAYRSQIYYTDFNITERGRWKEKKNGECIDEVIRGCYNNGTCVQPNVCKCSTGWTGYSCNIPLCDQICHHHGVCTGVNECTCERGWAGPTCLIPLCAQECQNSGFCVAPDTCKCQQWPNKFVDGRLDGGIPVYQDIDGTPLLTGYTGYDCSTPICVQSENFYLNSNISDKQLIFGGHGGDGNEQCKSINGRTSPRCVNFNEKVLITDGSVFQSGCGFDPYDTGCCIINNDINYYRNNNNNNYNNYNNNSSNNNVTCYRCDKNKQKYDETTFYCDGDLTIYKNRASNIDYFIQNNFTDIYNNLLLCGSYHNPRYHNRTLQLQDYGVAKYYISPDLNNNYTNFDYLSNYTSDRFLCNVMQWTQGDFIDDADLGSTSGMGSKYGLSYGRNVRINTPNVFYDSTNQAYRSFGRKPGEGVYGCYNFGSCIGPDVCTCEDGYTGYDCRTPLCRHLQPTGVVSSCLNKGICAAKDDCQCIQSDSVLYESYKGALRGTTGWTGTDCSMPMCVQGFFDPFCTDLPQAPGGEGCYRCSNGGNCTAPDVCTCAFGYSGYNCQTPTCEIVADALMRHQLGTAYEEKIISFEKDPCGVTAIYGLHGWKGRKYARGNCTLPNQCTCLCKEQYNQKSCKKTGKLCNGPFQDPLVSLRNLLLLKGPEYSFGSGSCARGYEGSTDSMNRFRTCHLTIFVPTYTQRTSLIILIATAVSGFIVFYFLTFRLKIFKC